jgi:hypothetical protein
MAADAVDPPGLTMPAAIVTRGHGSGRVRSTAMKTHYYALEAPLVGGQL